MDKLDCVIIGAGVVGLAIGRALALSGRDVVLLERHPSIGMETSSRNSEVIHAGVYYPKGSLKSRLCIRGKHLLYEYCRDHDVPYSNCGKLIVATEVDQLGRLRAIKETAADAGMPDLHVLDRAETLSKEPALRAQGALYSPTTGIIDSHSYMVALQTEIELSGGMVIFNSLVQSAKIVAEGFHVELEGGYVFSCKTLINSAGLHAPEFARNLGGFDPSFVPSAYLAKGSYFSLSGKCPFSHLIYPLPVPGGLGTHLTLDLAGLARFGPNVKWIDAIDYDVDPNDAKEFYGDIRTYWPDIKAGQLAPGYAGIRPKIVPQGAPAGDFVIQGPREHGVAQLINLFGIESPGLTSSLAIAEQVKTRL